MSTSYDIDTVVIGAGVAGLAVARALVQGGTSVWVLDQAERAGEGVSSGTSGVIHAGLYHPAVSLKTQLCVEGRERLYAFAEMHRVPHLRCGKLIIGQPGEDARLEAVRQTAAANGVPVDVVGRDCVTAREPRVFVLDRRPAGAPSSPTSPRSAGKSSGSTAPESATAGPSTSARPANAALE